MTGDAGAVFKSVRRCADTRRKSGAACWRDPEPLRHFLTGEFTVLGGGATRRADAGQ
jgi:hypothetical protein